MIRLFRKIRHQLLTKDKYSIYILYASGEILLVVIGILLALQIDNWNDNRIERKEEVQILLSLQSEFTINQNLLKNEVRRHNRIAINVRRLLDYCNPVPEYIHVDTLKGLISDMTWLPKYIPNQGVLNSIISSGRISLIQNKELNYKLILWKQLLENYNYSAEMIAHLVMNDLIPYVSKYYPFRNFEIEIYLGKGNPSDFTHEQTSLLSSLEFENILEMRRLDSESILEKAVGLREFQAEVLDLIGTELINLE